MQDSSRMITDSTIAPVSVCIPAHNEELTIGKTLESILAQTFNSGSRPAMEVIVCANVCTDGTVDVVKHLQESHRDVIKLLEVDERGKTNACNVLRKEASYDHVFFIDADTELDVKALAVMNERLQHSEALIAVGGTNAAILRDCSFLTRLSRPYAKDGILVKDNQDFIAGRCYGFKKTKLEAVLNEFGYDNIPDHLINEDRWLHRLLDVAASKHRGIPLESVILGEGRYWVVCHEALAYFVPQSWKEDAKLKARSFHGRDQISAYFPEYDIALARSRDRSPRSFVQRIRTKAETLSGMGLKPGIRQVISELMKRRAVRRARRLYEWNKAHSVEISAQNWIRSEASRVRSEEGIRI